MNLITRVIFRKFSVFFPTPDKPLKYQLYFHLIQLGLKENHTVLDDKNKARFTISRNNFGSVKVQFHQTCLKYVSNIEAHYTLTSAFNDRVVKLLTGKTVADLLVN